MADLITIVNILLGNLPPSACGFATDSVDVTWLTTAVDEALNGCPAPAPTATPTISFTYELGAGSTIAYTVSTTGVPPVVEILSGTFVAAVLPPQCCNVDLALAITSFEFHSAHFSVSGSAGGISSTTVSPSIEMSLSGTINGHPFDNMVGSAPLPIRGTRPFPPVFGGIEICAAIPADQSVTCDDIRAGLGTGYTLTIFATVQT